MASQIPTHVTKIDLARNLREANERIRILDRGYTREMKRADAWEREASVLREALTDALDRLGQPRCSECGGSGMTTDEQPVGGRDWMQVRTVRVECQECLETGRELA